MGGAYHYHGIDEVYQFTNPQPKYVVESKFGSASLNTLADGTKQMSIDWIDKCIRSILTNPKDYNEMSKVGYDSWIAKIDGDEIKSIKEIDNIDDTPTKAKVGSNIDGKIIK